MAEASGTRSGGRDVAAGRLDRETLAGFAGRPYAEVAAAVMRPFMAGSAAEGELDRLCRQAYGRFARAGVCPLVQIDEGTWLLELFHGPTLAFKDVAMQILGDLFDHVLAARGERITIVGATSGDTCGITTVAAAVTCSMAKSRFWRSTVPVPVCPPPLSAWTSESGLTASGSTDPSACS